MRTSFVTASVGMLVALFVACSGKTTSTTTSTTSPDAGVGPGASDCPASDPGDGPACSKNGQLCEYGDDWNPSCNKVRVCSSGRWATPFTSSGGAVSCPSVKPTIPPNPSDCPASASAIPSGTCSSTSTCSYDGTTCSCGVYCPSYPIQPPDCSTDGAPSPPTCCDRTKQQWNCFSGPAYCPSPRPRVGSACTKDGDQCAIEEPKECAQMVLRCEGGVWQLPNTSCPISTRKAKEDIHYLDRAEGDRLHDDLQRVRVASYRYRAGDDARHLGFVIEDMPEGSPAVLASRERVDLYGYVSMAVLSIQHQQREIDALRAEVERLGAENAACRDARKK